MAGALISYWTTVSGGKVLSEGPIDHGKHHATKLGILVYGANTYDLAYHTKSES